MGGPETVRVQCLILFVSTESSMLRYAPSPKDMMDAKMEKRRKGVFGPPAGKQFVVHVDDLNMPKQ